MPYAIFLVSKVTTPGMATSVTQHNFRLEETPNADPARPWLNQEYVNQEHRPYLQLANERLAELELVPRRRDAVRLVELVLTASADGFPRGADGRVRVPRRRDLQPVHLLSLLTMAADDPLAQGDGARRIVEVIDGPGALAGRWVNDGLADTEVMILGLEPVSASRHTAWL